MIYLVFFIGFSSGLLLGLFIEFLIKRIKKPFRYKKYDNEYKNFLEFDGGL